MAPRPGFGEYSQLVNEMPEFIQSKNRFSELSGEQDELFARANERPRIGGPEATIAALISALPAVIGAALMGEEGFAYGAKSSATGVGQTFDNLKALGDEEQKTALTKYTKNEKEMGDLRNYVQDLSKTGTLQDIAARERSLTQTHAEGLVDKRITSNEGIANANRSAANARAGRGAEITAERKKEGLRAKAIEYLSDPGRRAELKSDLEKSLGNSPEASAIYDNPNAAQDEDTIRQVMTQLEMRGDVAGVETKEAYPRLGAENLKARNTTIQNSEKTAAANEIKEFEKEYGDDPIVVEIKKKVNDVNSVEYLLGLDNPTADRQAMRQAAASIQSGVLTNQDAEAGGVTSLFGDLSSAYNYLSGETNTILNDQQKEAIINAARIARNRMVNELNSTRGEFERRAGARLPRSSERTRKEVVENLGSGVQESLEKPDGDFKGTYQGRRVYQRGNEIVGIAPNGTKKVITDPKLVKQIIADLSNGPQ